MLIKASKNGWKEVTADQNYFGEQSCYEQCSSSTKSTNTIRHWPTLSSGGLRNAVIKKPRKMNLNDLVRVVEYYECALHNNNNKLVLTGEPEDLVRALSKLATLAQ